MKGFLFDGNLPQKILFLPKLPIISLSKIGQNPTDSQLWEFAQVRELVIVTKDTDFSDRIIISSPPPWCIYVLAIFGEKTSTHCFNAFGHKSKLFSNLIN